MKPTIVHRSTTNVFMCLLLTLNAESPDTVRWNRGNIWSDWLIYEAMIGYMMVRSWRQRMTQLWTSSRDTPIYVMQPAPPAFTTRCHGNTWKSKQWTLDSFGRVYGPTLRSVDLSRITATLIFSNICLLIMTTYTCLSENLQTEIIPSHISRKFSV